MFLISSEDSISHSAIPSQSITGIPAVARLWFSCEFRWNCIDFSCIYSRWDSITRLSVFDFARFEDWYLFHDENTVFGPDMSFKIYRLTRDDRNPHRKCQPYA